jgi:hypothetical protein
MSAAAKDAGDLIENISRKEIQRPIEAIEKACGEVHRAWSGSNLGYRALVYYQGLERKPARELNSGERRANIRCPTAMYGGAKTTILLAT